MALTTSSFQADPQPPRDSRADADAACNSLDGTRMDRERNTSQVASQWTTSSAGESALGAAFIQGNGDTTHNWTTTAGKASGAKINGDSGFPGLFGPYPS